MKKAIVIGASGGIGSAFCQQCEESGYAVTRLSSKDMDIRNENDVKHMAEKLKDDAPYDLIFVATGLLHNDKIQPEKTIKQLDLSTMQSVFELNAFGPTLVLKNFYPLLHKDKPAYFGALSARVGSISDNRLGGWYSYRASKAALNMFLKTASIELSRTYKKLVVAGLHPGTVDTKLSQPFQDRVPGDKLFTPEFSAEKMFTVLMQLTPEMSGNCYAWDGAKIEF